MLGPQGRQVRSQSFDFCWSKELSSATAASAPQCRRPHARHQGRTYKGMSPCLVTALSVHLAAQGGAVASQDQSLDDVRHSSHGGSRACP